MARYKRQRDNGDNDPSASLPAKMGKPLPSENPEDFIIQVRIRNKANDQWSVVTIKRSVLVQMSEMMKILVENMDKNETEIVLPTEEDVQEATSFLTEIASVYAKRKPGQGPFLPPPWNQARAVLATKWVVEAYVSLYKCIMENHMTSVIDEVTDWEEEVEVTGLSTCQDLLTGVPSLPILDHVIFYKDDGQYSTRGDTGLIIEKSYSGWRILNGCGHTILTLDFDYGDDRNLRVHQVKGVWRLYTGIGIDQPGVVVSPGLPTANVIVFWEMVELTLQYVALRTDPIKTIDDLVEVLATRRDLRSPELMGRFMGAYAVVLLCQKLCPDF